MSNSSIWFVNEASPNERIQVCDAESAAYLEGALAMIPKSRWSRVVEPTKTESVETPLTQPAGAEVGNSVEVFHAGDDRRREARYEQEFRVILVSGCSTFRSATKDVSLHGMRLKAVLPESFMDTECKGYISHGNMRENIEVTCKTIRDPNGACRLVFSATEAGELDRLSEWLGQKSA